MQTQDYALAIPRCQANEIGVLRIVEPERTIKAQPLFQVTGRERKLRPTTVCPDCPDATDDKRGALLKREISVVALKDSTLETAQIAAEERFAGKTNAVYDRKIPIQCDADGIDIVLEIRRGNTISFAQQEGGCNGQRSLGG